MFEEPEEYFDRPAVVIHQGDDFRWDIGQVGGNSQKAIAVLASGASAGSPFRLVGFGLNDNQPNPMACVAIVKAKH